MSHCGSPYILCHKQSSPAVRMVITKQIELPPKLACKSTITVEYTNRAVYGVSQALKIDINNSHPMLCCITPVKTVTIQEDGIIDIILDSCKQCPRCIDHALALLSIADDPQQWLSLTSYPIVVMMSASKQFVYPAVLTGESIATVEIQHNPKKKLVICLEHTIDMKLFHAIMVCPSPHKSVRVKDGRVLQFTYRACQTCDMCKTHCV